MSEPASQTTTGARQAALILALTLSTIAVTPAPAAALAPEVSAVVVPAELTYGTAATVSGHAVDAGHGLEGARLALQVDPFPFRGFLTIARVTTTGDGSFAFAGVRLDRNARLRVALEAAPGTMSPVLSVIVDPAVAINAASLGPGRTRLSLRLRHAREGRSAPVSAWWFVAARGTHVFRLAAVTSTSELSPGLTYASATIDPPSTRFVYRVCLNPSWERAMGADAAHHRCPEHDFTVSHDVG
jgi:hypothetical protein